MNAPPIPNSLSSSPGSGSLELQVRPSLRLLAWLGAWIFAAGFAILDGRHAGGVVRGALLWACAAALLSGVPAILPWRGVAALRLAAGGVWQLRIAGDWHLAELERAVEVLRSGWWLQWRQAADGRRCWAWIDAAGTPRAGYRALCRALRQSGRDAGRGAAGAAPTADGDAVSGRQSRRRSQRAASR